MLLGIQKCFFFMICSRRRGATSIYTVYKKDFWLLSENIIDLCPHTSVFFIPLFLLVWVF